MCSFFYYCIVYCRGDNVASYKEIVTKAVIGKGKKYFRNNYKGSIISYANKRWSNGNLYKKLGFNLVRETEPNYFYFLESDYILHSRIDFQKHKLKSKLIKENKHLVIPQPGQSYPVINLNKQGIPTLNSVYIL